VVAVLVLGSVGLSYGVQEWGVSTHTLYAGETAGEREGERYSRDRQAVTSLASDAHILRMKTLPTALPEELGGAHSCRV